VGGHGEGKVAHVSGRCRDRLSSAGGLGYERVVVNPLLHLRVEDRHELGRNTILGIKVGEGRILDLFITDVRFPGPVIVDHQQCFVFFYHQGCRRSGGLIYHV